MELVRNFFVVIALPLLVIHAVGAGTFLALTAVGVHVVAALVIAFAVSCASTLGFAVWLVEG